MLFRSYHQPSGKTRIHDYHGALSTIIELMGIYRKVSDES